MQSHGFVSVIITSLLLWFISIVLERLLKINRIVYSCSELMKNSDNYKMLNIELMKRLSRSIDSNGTYRIKTRSTPQFARALAQFGMVIGCIIGAIIDPLWARKHFIEFKKETVDFIPYQIVCGMIISLYLYDLIIMDSYSRLDYPQILHHLLAIIACTLMIIGRFVPFATFYGMTMIMLAFPYKFFQAFRYDFSWRYPVFTRLIFKIMYIYTFILLSINVFAQIYFIIYGGIILSKLPIHDCISFGIACIFWIYQDSIVLKALKIYSQQIYESVDWKAVNKDSSDSGNESEMEIILVS